VDKVVITGAAGGLGSAAVTAYIGAGFHVVGVDRAPIPERESLSSYVADLTDVATMRDVLCEVGPVQHVVSIAGGALIEEKLNVDLPLEVFRASIEQNLTSAFVTLQTALPQLRAAEGDRSLTLTTSTDALISYGLPAYAAAKSGIIGLVHSLASSLGKQGIRINAVAPGDVPTARNRREWAHKSGWYETLAESNALRRLCTPEEIAATFLALSSQLTGVTGQVIIADAGLVGGQIVPAGS
jgi:NAD(P)-dependent dehydrogenase (short-subunit alcohol dehydrogenase family)